MIAQLEQPLTGSLARLDDLQDPSRPTSFDVVIVGAGLVGSALAAALAGSPLRVALVEARDWQEGVGPDGRASALGLGSVELFRAIGAWDPMQALGVGPIASIHISDGSFGGIVHLHRETIKREALGYIIENRVTQAGLRQVIESADNIRILSPARVQAFEQDPAGQHQIITLGSLAPLNSDASSDPKVITAKLLVACDGGRSPLRQMAGIPGRVWGYGQACLVTTVTTTHPHLQVAYERFQPWGPFAILPMTDPASHLSDLSDQGSHRSCVVWTIPEQEREHLLNLNDADFIQAMTPSFGSQLGPILSVTPRACYVPQRFHAYRYTDPRFVLVGDAAHTTHPVGGQGVNMGLRDVAKLAQILRANPQQDPGSPPLLQAYARSRRWDNQAVLLGTDLANRLFSNESIPWQWIRRGALLALEQATLLQRPLMLQAMGLAPHHPRLDPVAGVRSLA